MNPILAGVAVVVVAGAVVAVSMRDGRSAVLGLALVLLLSPVLADPMAEPAALAARSIGTVLASYLLWIAVRDRPEEGLMVAPTEGSRIGWPAEILLAASAVVVGGAAHGLGAPAPGPLLASAAGFAVAALAVAPALTGRDILRVGIGLLLLLDAALLVRAGLGGTPGALEHLMAAGMIVTVAGAVAALGRAARADGPGGFGFGGDTPVRARHEPDAHPLGDPPHRAA